MNPPPSDEAPKTKPRIGRSEIGVFLALLAINWTVRAPLQRGSPRVRASRFPTRRRSSRRFRSGNVSTVTAQDAAIQGTLEHAIRYPARDKNSKSATEFSTRVPDFADTKALDTLLQEKGVVVTAKAPPGTPWWETLLAGFGPTLLFFGLWYVVMRRSGSGSMFSFGKGRSRRSTSRRQST